MLLSQLAPFVSPRQQLLTKLTLLMLQVGDDTCYAKYQHQLSQINLREHLRSRPPLSGVPVFLANRLFLVGRYHLPYYAYSNKKPIGIRIRERLNQRPVGPQFYTSNGYCIH